VELMRPDLSSRTARPTAATPEALARRDFLLSVFGAPLAASWLAEGCTGQLDERRVTSIEGRLLGQDVAAGHMLRDALGARIAHVAGLPAMRTGAVIVGGGPAGLSAAYALARADYRDFVLLELEPELGGTSRGDSSSVTAYPWGAHYLPVPQRHNSALVTLLEEMAVVSGVDDDGQLRVNEPHLVRTPEERVFYRGFWYAGLYLEAGASAVDLAERARFEREIASWVAYRDGQGRRAFTLPLRLASDTPELRALDALPARAWLDQRGFRSPRLLWWLDYACRDDYGLGLADTSAWALLFYFAARIERVGQAPSDLITWPEGNFALVRHLRRASEGRVRSRALVLDVVDHPDGVEVLGWDVAQDRGFRYLAERAVLATPRFISRRIVRSLRDDPLHAPPPLAASYAPWLVANLHLSERPRTRGAPLAWDNVLYDSPSLGYVCATHQRGSDYGPTVLTYYLPLTDADPKRARQKLFDGDYARWRDAVLLDLGRAHPDLLGLVTQLDVFRWGHAMVRPTVGARYGTGRLEAALARGRLHFAHSDLSGVSLFEEAFDHGVRAAGELLSVLRPNAMGGAP
jgi:phytoene dehydrogenase-like protein